MITDKKIDEKFLKTCASTCFDNIVNTLATKSEWFQLKSFKK